MIAPESLSAQAKEWARLAVPFLHQGRTRNGADCLGFIAAVLDELGSKTFIDYLPINYGRQPQSLLLEGLETLCRQIPLQPGALIVIRWPQTPFPSHAAIYTGNSIIHSYQTEGRVLEHGYRGPWVSRTVSIWALPLVKYLAQGDPLAM